MNHFEQNLVAKIQTLNGDFNERVVKTLLPGTSRTDITSVLSTLLLTSYLELLAAGPHYAQSFHEICFQLQREMPGDLHPIVEAIGEALRGSLRDLLASQSDASQPS